MSPLYLYASGAEQNGADSLIVDVCPFLSHNSNGIFLYSQNLEIHNLTRSIFRGWHMFHVFICQMAVKGTHPSPPNLLPERLSAIPIIFPLAMPHCIHITHL